MSAWNRSEGLTCDLTHPSIPRWSKMTPLNTHTLTFYHTHTHMCTQQHTWELFKFSKHVHNFIFWLRITDKIPAIGAPWYLFQCISLEQTAQRKFLFAPWRSTMSVQRLLTSSHNFTARLQHNSDPSVTSLSPYQVKGSAKQLCAGQFRCYNFLLSPFSWVKTHCGC